MYKITGVSINSGKKAVSGDAAFAISIMSCQSFCSSIFTLHFRYIFIFKIEPKKLQRHAVEYDYRIFFAKNQIFTLKK